MTDPRVLILGHSFIHRLHSFIVSSSNLTLLLGIAEPIVMKWHGIGGRTIAKVLAYDLHVVESFQPHLVILELGTNDLSNLDPTTVGSSLEDLAQVLHSRYGVQRVVVCQTLFRDKATEFNNTVTLLNKYSCQRLLLSFVTLNSVMQDCHVLEHVIFEHVILCMIFEIDQN